MSSSLVGCGFAASDISLSKGGPAQPYDSNMGVCGSNRLVPSMVEIDVTCHLEAFRRFLISSTCRSFIPESYLRDEEVFPEKEMDPGSIYIEAADKVTLKKIRDITFINAREILGIIYTSKSGNSKLKWRQMRGPVGRITGEASGNSLVNMSMARIISPQDVEEIMSRAGQGAPEGQGGEDQPSQESGTVEVRTDQGSVEPENSDERPNEGMGDMGSP